MAIGLVSCKIQRDTLYGKCGKQYYACTQILIRSNGEFEYFRFYDVGGSTIVKGQWRMFDDTICLNTYEQQKNRLDTVIESTIQGQKFIVEFRGGFWGYISVDSTKYDIEIGQNTLEIDKPLSDIIFYIYDEQGMPVPVLYSLEKPSTNHLLVKIRRLTTNLILRDLKFTRMRNQLKSVDQSWTLKRAGMKSKQW